MPETYIREFPHPSAIIHFHPRPYIDGEFKWEHIQFDAEIFY